MKKVIFLVIIVITAIGLFAAGFCMQSDFDGFSGVMAQQSDGTMYVAKEEKGKNTIIQMNETGTLLMQYTFPQKKGESIASIKSMYVDQEDTLYLLKEWVDVESGNIVGNDIIRLVGKFSPTPSFDTVFTETGTKLSPIADMAVEEGILYKTTFQGDGSRLEMKGIVLPTDNSPVTAESEETLFCRLEKNTTPEDSYRKAAVMGSDLYVLLKNGTLMQYTALEGTERFFDSLPRFHTLIRSNDKLIALGEGIEVVITKGNPNPQTNNLSEILGLSRNQKFFAGACSEMGVIYAGRNEEGKTLLNGHYGNQLYLMNRVDLSVIRVLQNLWIQVVVILLTAAAVAALYYFLKKKNRLGRKSGIPRLRLVLSILASVGVLGGFLIGALTVSYRTGLINEQQVLSGTIHKQITNAIENIDYTGTLNDEFLDTADGKALTDSVSQADDLQSTYDVRNSVFAYSDGSFFNFICARGIFLDNVETEQGTQYVELLSKAIKTQGVSTYLYGSGNSERQITISPIIGKFSTVTGVVVTEMKLGGVQQAVERFFTRTILIFIGFLAVLALLLIKIFQIVLSPISRIPRILVETVQGRADEGELRIFEKSYESIYRAFNEVSRVWNQRVHEMNSITNSYYRFVPRKIQQILGKHSVSDIHCGDSRMVEGVLVMITVKNRESAKIKYGNDLFMSFVNKCFRMIHSNAGAHNGILLSGDFNLGEIRILYQNQNDAVAYAVALHDGAAGTPEDDTENPEFFVTVHQTSFLYGIAGSENQVFPFMISQEMDFVGSLKNKFNHMGSRVLVTEEIYRQLPEGRAIRYIGYVRDEVTGKSFKLYEVLDAYGARERQVYERLSGKLEEAIGLFYKNDFYLARSLFSSILYECPADGVARWYLFACDKFFHMEDGDIFYDLFGIQGN